ncbi:MAG TPA: carboxylating nicotinate-nucleotide diphosphorylase [Gemmatimonadaceae bacterium]|nr:carboxylating nicotinate-nucleotide diphosphorylase [Gemmatimonadaceae bacterium]
MTPDDDPRPPRRVTPLQPVHFSRAASGFPLGDASIVALVQSALDEDAADRDLTTIATVIPGHRARAQLVTREAGVVCGVPLALAAFRLLDPEISIRVDADDGTQLARGAGVLFISGRARGMLSAERTALNFMQRLSGIATLTRRFVDAVAGTSARIVDTRKTTPGWRALEKYAVRCGGGYNLRFDLTEAVLIKDNHLSAVGGDVAEAVRRVRAHAPEGTTVQVECDTVAQVRAAVVAGAESVLLDNMTPEQLRESIAVARGHCLTEASGGVNLQTVAAIAATGVDRISVGALTHSAPALNLALDFE